MYASMTKKNVLVKTLSAVDMRLKAVNEKKTSNTSFHKENFFFMLKCQSSRAQRNFKAKLLTSRAGRRGTRREFSEL